MKEFIAEMETGLRSNMDFLSDKDLGYEQLKKVAGRNYVNLNKKYRRFVMSTKTPGWIKVIRTSAVIVGILGSILGYAYKKGVFVTEVKAVEAKISEVSTKTEKLDNRMGVVEKNVAVLQEIVPRVEDKIDDFRIEQRTVNTEILRRLPQ